MITVYDSDGRIQYTVDEPYPVGLIDLYDDLATADPEFNHITIAEADVSEKYIDTSGTPTLEDRPDMTLIYPVSVTAGEPLTMSGLPANAVVTVDGTTNFSPDTGEDTIEVNLADPGVYDFYVAAWPYLDLSFSITAS